VNKADRCPDAWLFPDETLAQEYGDCKDLAFLLAAQLLASGISAYCVRVALSSLRFSLPKGRIQEHDHCWVMYQNEGGAWEILEPLGVRCVKQVDHSNNCHEGQAKNRGAEENHESHLSSHLAQLAARKRPAIAFYAATMPTRWTQPNFRSQHILTSRHGQDWALGGITQRSAMSFRLASERKDQFAAGVVVSHHDVHLLE
jgi:hypothetical protein